MTGGLLIKIVREVWLMTLLFGLALLAVSALLTFVLPQIQAGLGGIFEQIPFARTMFSAILGTELGETISAQTLQAFLWVHPVVLALIWAFEISICTRIPAGEIDRGTIDVLLGLPVSRRQLYYSEVAVWLAFGLLILLMGFVGHRVAAPAMPPEMRPAPRPALLVTLNLYCVYVAVGGIAFFVSSLSNRRGRAMAVVFAIVLASFLLNFVAQFWSPARRVSFLGVMDYYQPARVLQTGAVPLTDMAVLLLIGVSLLVAGGEITSRRSICTV